MWLGFDFSIFPFLSFHFELPSFPSQFSNRQKKSTSEFFRTTSTYPQHNKRPVAEYFDRSKMSHPIENTRDTDSISFKPCMFSRLTHGCLDSLQSKANLAIRKYPSSSHFRLRTVSPLWSSRVPHHESRVPGFWVREARVPAIGISHAHSLLSSLQPSVRFGRQVQVLRTARTAERCFCEFWSPKPVARILVRPRAPLYLLEPRTPGPERRLTDPKRA